MAKILVVDDNPLNLTLVRVVLEMHGFDVETAENGKTGVEKALASPPDLVLMDLRMPVMNGAAAMHRLHQAEATRNIPVVVLTASAMKGAQELLLADGFDGYIEKPIDLATFPERIRTFIGRD